MRYCRELIRARVSEGQRRSRLRRHAPLLGGRAFHRQVGDEDHAFALLLYAHVVICLAGREVLLDDGEQLLLELLDAARRELRAVVRQHELEPLLQLVLGLPAPEQTEHHAPPNRRLSPARNPPWGSRLGQGTSSPRTRLAMSRKAVPAPSFVLSSNEAGLPMFVETRMRRPPRWATSGRRRWTISRASGISRAASGPMTRSASRTLATSGLPTTTAPSAALAAVWNPASMPAGLSMSTRSNASSSISIR